MALLVASWDLPESDPGLIFKKETKAWESAVKKQPGALSFHACSKPHHNVLEAIALQEFDSIKQALVFMYSDEFASLCSHVLAHGCTNIDTKVWDDNDVAPLGGVIKSA